MTDQALKEEQPETDHGRILDHVYDGIQEYDNPLPGWWVGLFWVTVLFAPFYFVYYHFGVGMLEHDEYMAASADALAAQNKVLEGVTVDEKLLLEWQADADLMDGASQIFNNKCVTCHGAGGTGGACPNLTDAVWLHGPKLFDHYKVIRDGVTGKEMKSWLPDIGPAGCVAMAAYVGTLSKESPKEASK